MVAPDLHDEATAAYEARKELGPDYERAVLESFVANATESIGQRVDARLTQQGICKVPQKQQRQQTDDSYLAVPGLLPALRRGRLDLADGRRGRGVGLTR
ncbi:hypothetical protein QCN29_03340 [Streptomyces sp. HNM0663]|uniref:Uncharacterized protein n=1 Tax=Streptomyces chengmaiensis TaxID=3040919 RepID=A0ABT6HGE9_9ACTN|nr:hypothetical protein [Streptomyces chengmaiensis]MDH2387838.1 hypothetical protein [Streptomyces chengmaiensis]